MNVLRTLLVAVAATTCSCALSADERGIYRYFNINNRDVLVLDYNERIAHFGPYGDLFSECEKGIICFETYYFLFAVPSMGALEKGKEWETICCKYTVLNDEEKFKIVGNEYYIYVINAQIKDDVSGVEWLHYYSTEHGLIAMHRFVNDKPDSLFFLKDKYGLGSRKGGE